MTSHSSTNKFNTCPRAYYYAKEKLIEKCEAGSVDNDRVWGVAIHAALASFYKGWDRRSAGKAFDLIYNVDLNPDDRVKTVEGGHRTLEAYFERWEGVDNEQWEILHVEEPKIDESEKVELVIDLVAKHRHSGSIYFFDHKTTSKINPGVIKQYELDAQLSRYTVYVEERFGDCAGAIVNLICPGFRQRAYKGQPAGWHFRFQREIYSRSPEQIEFWKRSQADWEKMISWCKETNCWPAHLGRNCSYCEFWELCYANGDFETVDSIYQRKEVKSDDNLRCLN